MEYIKFTLLFFVIHTITYYIAGAINYQFSKKLYGGKWLLNFPSKTRCQSL